MRYYVSGLCIKLSLITNFTHHSLLRFSGMRGARDGLKETKTEKKGECRGREEEVSDFGARAWGAGLGFFDITTFETQVSTHSGLES